MHHRISNHNTVQSFGQFGEMSERSFTTKELWVRVPLQSHKP